MPDAVSRDEWPACGAGPVLDGLHFLSGGAVGFARGLNDTPKIVALLLAGAGDPPEPGLVLVAVRWRRRGASAPAGWPRRWPEDHPAQPRAGADRPTSITALLVTVASRFGLPVSTTHVSVGSLFGIGLVNGTARAEDDPGDPRSRG